MCEAQLSFAFDNILSVTNRPQTTSTMASREPRLDEIVWSQPFPQGIHSNSVLYYFADSPFFDRTSNNAVLINQGMNNLAMREFLYTREAFEGRLRSMSGLEFVVAQEPAETGPGAGTGVWVIRKQTRRKRHGEEDDITVHAAYFIVGEHIYMAPTLGDIFSSRVVSSSLNFSPPPVQLRPVRGG